MIVCNYRDLFGGFGFPLLLAGIACIIYKRYPVLASIWGLFIGLNLLYRFVNGGSWSTIRQTSKWTPERNWTTLNIAWAIFIAGIILIIVSAIVLAEKKRYPLPVNSNGSVNIKKLVIFILSLAAVYFLMFRLPVGTLFGISVDMDPELLLRRTRIAGLVKTMVDSYAVVILSAWLARAISWAKQLIEARKAKSI